MITFRCTYHNRTFISLRDIFSSGLFGTSTIQCTTSRTRKVLCYWCRCRYRQILTSNVLNMQLHQNAESTSTGKVQCCRELNRNSFCVSIQVDTSCVRSLLTAGWPKFTLQTQLTNENSTFAFRISSWHPKTL